MKKNYQKPEMNVVLLQHQASLLAGSITDVDSGDAGIGFSGGSGGGGRAREFGGIWDDE